MGWKNPIDEWHDSPEGKEYQRRNMAHADICYGHWGKCISCGCNRNIGQACVSHRDSEGYKIYLMERMTIAQEMAAEKGPE